MTQMRKSKKIAYYGLFAALALMLGYVESLLPSVVPVPGIKLGLANIIVVLAIYVMDFRSAAGISVVRVALAALLFGGFAGFLYSLAGAGLSLLAMGLGAASGRLSPVAVSVLGGVAHNIGQLLVAMLVVATPGLIYYLPPLIVAGVVTGIFIGLAASAALKAVKPAPKSKS